MKAFEFIHKSALETELAEMAWLRSVSNPAVMSRDSQPEKHRLAVMQDDFFVHLNNTDRQPGYGTPGQSPVIP